MNHREMKQTFCDIIELITYKRKNVHGRKLKEKKYSARWNDIRLAYNCQNWEFGEGVTFEDVYLLVARCFPEVEHCQ